MFLHLSSLVLCALYNPTNRFPEMDLVFLRKCNKTVPWSQPFVSCSHLIRVSFSTKCNSGNHPTCPVGWKCGSVRLTHELNCYCDKSSGYQQPILNRINDWSTYSFLSDSIKCMVRNDHFTAPRF